MSKYVINSKAGEWHVWTKTGHWVAWFRTEAEAKRFVDAHDAKAEERVREFVEGCAS